MRSIFKSRLGRASAAVALAALGVLATTTAEARPWHYYNGYYGPSYALNAWAGAVAGAAVASNYYYPRYYYPPPAYTYYPPPYRYYPPPAYGYYGPEPVGPTFGLMIR